MKTQIHRYLARLYDTIRSRREINVETLEIIDRSDQPGQTGMLHARLRFYDGSLLEVVEVLAIQGLAIVKARYVYHYQDAQGNLVFRYDNAPHHPEVASHPHHKHVGRQVIAADPPDLSQVLREIDERLYGVP